ncbi:MAG: DUF4199 domain-containing protein [Bacteroidales bacterium]|jgi:uncharacterized membrane protein (DUF485 family)|nr:DUF4199 domain-containing protein [Bacteroidales bacterium]
MEEKSIKSFKAGLTNGIILGLALIIYSVLLYVLDLSLNKYLGYVSYVIMIAVIIYATNSHKNNTLKGNISYGQALGLATLIIVFGSLLSSIYTYVFVTVIDPGHIEKILVAAEEQLLEKGMTDDQIEMAISMQKKMMKPFMLSILAFFGYVLIGFILSLITSAFLKKEGDPYQEAMQDIEE